MSAGPLQVDGEVLSSKEVGDYHHLTLVAPGIAERFRPGNVVSLAVGGGSPGVSALEVDLAARDRERPTRVVGEDPPSAGNVVSVVAREVPRGVAMIVKLCAGTLLTVVAEQVADSGADAIVVAHPPCGLAIDPDTLRGSVSGGLSGPAVLPLALEAVWHVAVALPELPVVGVGGVRTGLDALAMVAAGASAVQVGAATLSDPGAPLRTARELADELARRGLSLADAVGIAGRGGPQ